MLCRLACLAFDYLLCFNVHLLNYVVFTESMEVIIFLCFKLIAQTDSFYTIFNIDIDFWYFEMFCVRLNWNISKWFEIKMKSTLLASIKLISESFVVLQHCVRYVLLITHCILLYYILILLPAETLFLMKCILDARHQG